MKEQWRVVPGCPDLRASDRGRIKRAGGDVIAPVLHPTGYVYVNVPGHLCGGKKRRFLSVHRLIAQAFIGNCAAREVDHLNGDRTDNRPQNLWVTTRPKNLLAKGLVRRPNGRETGVLKQNSAWLVQLTTGDGTRVVERFSTRREANARARELRSEIFEAIGRPSAP
jgi:HNH endonuclease